MTKFLILIQLILLNSCSTLGWSENTTTGINLDSYQRFEKSDYISHMKNFENLYLNHEGIKTVKLSTQSKRYLSGIADIIIKKNELFFTQEGETNFHVIKSNTPFHFSLPGRKIFFSSSLIEKYINNETMLFCMLVYELIRSEKSLYEKQIIIPAGTLSTSRILSLLRLDIANKVEVHKWAFYILKRVGIDTDSYLSWLQIKNRNSLDFSMQIGDVQSISREEALFKSFLIQEVKNTRKNLKYKGSSRDFYTFVRNIKG